MSADSDVGFDGELLRVHCVPRDGNCFFHAVAEGLRLGTCSLPGHVLARRAVVRHVCARWGRWRRRVIPPSRSASVAEYRRHMGRDATPATAAEVAAAAEALGADILVHTSSRVYRFKGVAGPGPGRNLRVVHLRFTGPPGAGHYDLLEPVGRGRSESSEVLSISSDGTTREHGVEALPSEVFSEDFLLLAHDQSRAWRRRCVDGRILLASNSKERVSLQGGGPSSKKSSKKIKKRAVDCGFASDAARQSGERDRNKSMKSLDSEDRIVEILRYPPPVLLDLVRDMSDTQLADVYFCLLQTVKESLVSGNFRKFQESWKIVRSIAGAVSDGARKLTEWFQHCKSPFSGTNLMIVACKYCRWNMLQYLLVYNDNSFDVNLFRQWDWENCDEENHCGLYYVIKSGNVEACEMVVSKWSMMTDSSDSRSFVTVLERVYEELLLKRVNLSDRMVAYIEKKLLDARFFMSSQHCSVLERIDLILEAISTLTRLENGSTISDALLHCIVQFVLRSIANLEGITAFDHLKIPLEEMQFALGTYLQTGSELYHFVLTKGKIIHKLKAFAQDLSLVKVHLMSNSSSNSALSLETDLCIESEPTDVSKHLDLKDLYEDFQVVRDIFSLENMSKYMILAADADCNDRMGQLVIQRTLLFIGECFKLSFRTPKLSASVVKLLHFVCPGDVRYIFLDLSNVLSHASSLCESNNSTASEFFRKVQHDLKKFTLAVDYALFKRRLNLLKEIAQRVLSVERIDDVMGIIDAIKKAPPKRTSSFPASNRPKETTELSKIEELLIELSKEISRNTPSAIVLNELKEFVAGKSQNLMSIVTCYNLALSQLLSGFEKVSEGLSAAQALAALHQYATNALNTVTSYTEAVAYQRLPELVRMLTDCLETDGNRERSPKVRQILVELIGVCELALEDARTTEFRIQTSSPDVDSARPRPSGRDLSRKLQLLKRVLDGLKRGTKLDVALAVGAVKSDGFLRAAVEVLVMDILSDLNDRRCLVENPLCLDERAGILTGRQLLTHLTHGEALAPALMTSPAVAVLLNAIKLYRDAKLLLERAEQSPAAPVSSQILKSHLEENLRILTIQEDMFRAAEDGDVSRFHAAIKAGADVMGRRWDAWTALHCAVKGGHLRIVQYLCDNNVDINCLTLCDESALHIAALHGQKCVAEYLMNQHAMSPNIEDYKKRTPLHIAAFHGHLEVVVSLLKHRADMNARDNCNYLPVQYAAIGGREQVLFYLLNAPDAICTSAGHCLLLTAAEMGHASIVKRLVRDCGADIHSKNDRNWTPLHAAAYYGHVEVVRTLIKLGANVNARVMDGCTPLHFAAQRGHEAVLKLLLESGAAVNVTEHENQCTPLLFAAQGGHLGVLEHLIKKKADVNAKNVTGATALMLCSCGGRAEMVRVLLDHGAAVNERDQVDGMTALLYAAHSGHSRVAELLIGAGAEADIRDSERQFTALEYAADCGDLETAALLIRNGAQLDSSESDRRTPLLIAAAGGHEGIVRLLLDSGATVSSSDPYADNALHFAATRGHTEIVQLLLDRGLNVNAANSSRDTALHLATRNNHIQVVKLLLSRGANVNAINDNGATPLFKAICAASKDVAQLLIEAGADVNAKTDDGVRPLLAAVKKNCKDIVQLLLDYGVDVNARCDSRPTALSLAVFEGLRDVVRVLLSCPRTDRTLSNPDGTTILHVAAQFGNTGMVTDLIEWGCDVNVRLYKSRHTYHGATPLHLAANSGFSDVIRALLSRGADVNARDAVGRTAIHFSSSYLDCTRALVAHSPQQVHALGPNNYTPLHFAVAKNSIDVVKFLVSNGADIHARTSTDLEPIHLAAERGCLQLVQYFLERGCRVGDRGGFGSTLLHQALTSRNDELVAYLLDIGADVNAKIPRFGYTPLHLATGNASPSTIKLLLDRGAVFDAKDNQGRTPGSTDQVIAKSLKATAALFKAIKKQDIDLVRAHIANGAFVNARRSDGSTLLALAAWKGCVKIVAILLGNGAHPNTCGKNGFTALHYAATFGHVEVVQALLAEGAVYNCISWTGESPLQCAGNAAVERVLTFVADCFKKVEMNDLSVIDDLEKEENIDLVKPLLNAHNELGRSVIDVGLLCGFLHINRFMCLPQGMVEARLLHCEKLKDEGKYAEAEQVYRQVLEEKRTIFGPNSSGILDVEEDIAMMMCLQNKLGEALAALERIYDIRVKRLGPQHALSLHSRVLIAVVLHRLNRNVEALQILKDAFSKQCEILPRGDMAITRTAMDLATVLRAMGDLPEALRMFRKAHEMLGAHPDSSLAVPCLHSMGVVLSSLKHHEEAVSTLQEALRWQRKRPGAAHQDTGSVQMSLADALLAAGMEEPALAQYWDLLRTPGHDPVGVIMAKDHVTDILCARGKLVPALKLLEDVLECGPKVLGPRHPLLTSAKEKMNIVKMRFSLVSPSMVDRARRAEEVVRKAVVDRDVDTVVTWLRLGCDPNASDPDGRSLLMLAAYSGHLPMVCLLLQEGADPTRTSRDKGNTPLHTAVAQRNTAIAARLLQHVQQHQKPSLCAFVNARTSTGGTSCMHIAAKEGSLELIKCLLTHGAAYDVCDASGATPRDLCKDRECRGLIQVLQEMFTAAESGNNSIKETLGTLISMDVLEPVLKARNRNYQTLAQVAIANQHKEIAAVILSVLRTV